MTQREESSNATQKVFRHHLKDQQTEDLRRRWEQERLLKFNTLKHFSKTFQLKSRALTDGPGLQDEPPDPSKDHEPQVKWAQQLRHYEEEIRQIKFDDLKEFSKNFQLKPKAAADASGMRKESSDMT